MRRPNYSKQLVLANSIDPDWNADKGAVWLVSVLYIIQLALPKLIPRYSAELIQILVWVW